MEFNPTNYPQIRDACNKKQAIAFYVNKSATCFSNGKSPEEWTSYPPITLCKEALGQIFAYAPADERGTLTKLELIVHLLGGEILYKKRDNDKVDLNVKF